MGYLITKDYLRIIQTTELNAITGSDVSVRTLMEGSVEKEIRSYLIQRYDLTNEFQSLDVFSYTTTYKVTNRVYLDATTYSAAATYALNVLTLYSGSVYICTTAITVAEAFNSGHWTLLGAQYDLFYVKYPNPLFDQDTFYKKGDVVYWKGKNYTAQRDSVLLTHEQELQALEIEDIRRANVFPDDINTGAALSMWGTGTTYTIPAGTLPTDTTYWTFGDSRNQQLVKIYMAMVVYELCARIAPNNIPEARHNNWLQCVKMLKDFANGNLNAELPLIQPKQGATVRFGGKVRQQNSW